jgi:hypothetical protein
MKTAIHPHASLTGNYGTTKSSFSISALWQRLIAFADSQEPRRFFWAAISLLGHGTVFTIGTLAAVILTGISTPLLVAACYAMVMVVIVNLAALPMRYVIPVFFLSLLIDFVVIVLAFALWQ